MEFLVLDVLRNRRNAQVGYSIIGFVSVDVVDVHAFWSVLAMEMSPSNLMRVIVPSENSYESVSSARFWIGGDLFSNIPTIPAIPSSRTRFPCENASFWTILNKAANIFWRELNQVGH